MKSTIQTQVLAALSLIQLSGSAEAGKVHEHGGDVVVGRTGLGQLAVEFDSDEALELAPVSGLLNGWADDEPGFMSLGMDEPKEDFFTLGSGAQIVFEIVSIDPALKVWSPGFISQLDAVGEQFVLGGSEFDTHGTFQIDPEDSLFDPQTELYSLTFRLVDTGTTGYSPSADYTATFAAVPEPSLLVLFAVGGVLTAVRQRPRRRSNP